MLCFPALTLKPKQVKGEHEGEPFTGIVYSVTDDMGKPVSAPIKSSLIGKNFGFDGLNKRMKHNTKEFKAGKWKPKIRNEVVLAMHGSGGDRHSFINLLKGRGIDVVFRENEENRIYGVTFIDHNSKEVYNGSRLGKEFSANVFNRLFNEPSDEPRLHNEATAPTFKETPFRETLLRFPKQWSQPSNRHSAYSASTSMADNYEEEAFTLPDEKEKRPFARYIISHF